MLKPVRVQRRVAIRWKSPRSITLTVTDTLCLGGSIGGTSVSYYKVPDDSGGYFAMARSVVTGEAKNSLQALALVVGRVQRPDSE